MYSSATDSAMRYNFRLLATIAAMVVSGITHAQSSGTAFVVAPGLLVTNHHVIDGCGSIEVIAADGRRPAAVVDSVEQIDLALLRVYGLRGGVASLRTQSPTMLGEPATVFGFPLGGALSSTGNFTTGVVSSLRGLRDAAGEIQITAPVQPGNSGGPVLDRAGAVIGVVSSRLSHNYTLKATGGLPQNVNFAVALDVLSDFLAKNSVSFTAADRQAALETTQVAEMAQTFTYKISCTAASRTATAPRPQAPVAPAAPTPDKLVQDIQTALNQRGFNAGTADGYMGPQTQAAIIAAQKMMGISLSGQPSPELLNQLNSRNPTASTGGSAVTGNLLTYTDHLAVCVRSYLKGRDVTFYGSGINPNPSARFRVGFNQYGNTDHVSLLNGSGNVFFDRLATAGIQYCKDKIPTFTGGPRYLEFDFKL
jgi:S1-C subfamily serine protease